MDSKRVLGTMLMAVWVLPACKPPAETAPAPAPAPVSTAAPAAPTGTGERWTMTADSKIGFVGSKVTGKHNGGFERFTGSVELFGKTPAGAKVMVEIDATSVWADDPKLTEHLKSADFFDVAKYPTIKFESTSVAEAGAMQWTLTGNLELHGVTKTVSFPATIQVLETRLVAQAELVINRGEFGIVYPGAADNLIRDEVMVRLDIEAEKPGTGTSAPAAAEPAAGAPAPTP